MEPRTSTSWSHSVVHIVTLPGRAGVWVVSSFKCQRSSRNSDGEVKGRTRIILAVYSIFDLQCTTMILGEKSQKLWWFGLYTVSISYLGCAILGHIIPRLTVLDFLL
ncbi:hypothetical protein M405DRAFT_237190 [Rhizopogon salebrosus TDB-379]|nr:hypothetical protein M405DRAFT_237190 [Rhizopogon salebrosus TDB-379]